MSGSRENPGVEPRAGSPVAEVGQGTRAASSADDAETIRLLQETVEVSKQQVLAGTVRVSTRTETYDDVAEVTLDRDRVDVTRVRVGHIVDVAPGVRTEGDVTIVPVIEERLVVLKQLYLKEELHIRRRVEQEVTSVPVQLRRQSAVVERLDASGNVVVDPSLSP